ncbi:hypothetical protein [Aquisalimonas asiatica]|uniref:Uncharacterized protein n=1 Tax=Aquisalimonas asiatica TaxID=406100 RepID=A0A1H8TBV1_9GAMM|nr:hypothetical protein [Aquisalimonas asiatica]SEO87963.1 hypothetical protein SAMN04488052_10411 [Aquisalimonas asiatica]
MASPNEWLRMMERQGLMDDIRLFRRLNPPESDSTRIDQLPYSVRSALENWRQWYVVSREHAKWWT